MYENENEGGNNDFEKAKIWYQFAADAGHETAYANEQIARLEMHSK